jgi:peptidoglycan/xylan/chitin deacetylase (PgdA/CDA1 family)
VSRPVGTVRAVATTEPDVVLTYDDGPDPRDTAPILEQLEKHGATATFFVLTGRAKQHSSLLCEVMAAGHEIALHGIDHTRLTQYPAAEVLRRCKQGKAELEELTGREVRWFRAPYGALQLPHWLAVRRAGMEPVGWGPTPGDWRHVAEEEMAADAMHALAAGEIMLAHDGFAGPGDGVDDGPQPVLDRGRLAGLMLNGLQERGLRARSLGEALTAGDHARRWAWFRH